VGALATTANLTIEDCAPKFLDKVVLFGTRSFLDDDLEMGLFVLTITFRV
jgi:hypothetical protein